MSAFTKNMYIYMYLDHSAWTVNLHNFQDAACITMN